jgi:hypothetical protein
MKKVSDVKPRVKFYIVNAIFMFVNTLLLCYIKFTKYNRSMIGNTGEIPAYIYAMLVIMLAITAVVNVVAIVFLVKKRSLCVSYCVAVVIFLIIPYLAYRVI